jgi:hypothetical protein
MRWLLATSRWITVPVLLGFAAVFALLGVWSGALFQLPMEIAGLIMLFFLACAIACVAAVAHLFIRNIFLAAAIPTALYFIPAEGRIVLINFDPFISFFIIVAAAQIFVLSLAVGVPFYFTRRRAIPPLV